jgi:hypothetical protein
MSTIYIMPRVLNKHTDPIPVGAVYIGRGSPYGNPFSHMHGTKAEFIVNTRREAIKRFEKEVLPHLDVSALRGKDLVCFCSPKPCHGDAILKKANSAHLEGFL